MREKTNKKDFKKKVIHHEKKKTSKIDSNSHHKNNFLVCFSNSKSEIRKALVNAIDKKNAIRIAINRLCRLYPEIDISRARIGGIFDNRKKTIKMRIG